ncbi:MAG: DUF1232 domain-containing protein [Firmicutes bacterium]|nr:DUF1232 domain-containing protein [Bacillota bacterium]
MQCPNCHEEVLLAEVCPYCGADVPAGEQVTSHTEEETTGVFVGKLDGQQRPAAEFETPRYQRPAKRPGFFSLLRYFFDPQVPAGRKLLIIGLIIYILSPVDLLPDLVPLVGWFDDLAVGTFLWTFISQELARYTRGGDS